MPRYRVPHSCLLPAAASAAPVTSGSASLRHEGNIPHVTAPGPTLSERKKKVPTWAVVWATLVSTAGGSGGLEVSSSLAGLRLC